MPARIDPTQRRKIKSYTLSASAIEAVDRFAAELGVSQSQAIEVAVEAFDRSPDRSLGVGEQAVLVDPRGGYLVVRRVHDLEDV